jgi:ferredoxin-like protein FixX
MAKGSMHATGKMSFRPDDAKFFKAKTGNVDVTTYLCLDCGDVRLKADAEKVKKLTDQT